MTRSLVKCWEQRVALLPTFREQSSFFSISQRNKSALPDNPLRELVLTFDITRMIIRTGSGWGIPGCTHMSGMKGWCGTCGARGRMVVCTRECVRETKYRNIQYHERYGNVITVKYCQFVLDGKMKVIESVSIVLLRRYYDSIKGYGSFVIGVYPKTTAIYNLAFFNPYLLGTLYMYMVV